MLEIDSRLAGILNKGLSLPLHSDDINKLIEDSFSISEQNNRVEYSDDKSQILICLLIPSSKGSPIFVRIQKIDNLFFS